MVEKIIAKHRQDSFSEAKQDFRYWLTKTPRQRLAAVDFLRGQIYGNTGRFQRTARVIQRSQG
jgi:hypothetical protein